MQRYGFEARLAAAAATAVLIAGCEDRGRQIDAPQPASLAELEAATELPYAEPSQVSYYEPERGYEWAERAYGLQRAFYDVPPDYGFYYDEVEPYVWETADDWALYAEPWGADYLYYYYEPGAAFPYFVRDWEYGYAFGPTGLLIAVFDTGGRYLPVDVVYRVAPTAGRYYARGHDLRRASRAARRIRIDDRTWATEGPRVSRSAGAWLRAARNDQTWRQWRERTGDRELVRFQAETRRREDAAEAWRERMARQQSVRPQDRRLETEALRAQRAEVREDRRDVQAAQRQARFEQRAQQERRAQVQAEQRERSAGVQRQAQAERQQARIAQQQAQAEARRNQQAERRQQVQQAQQAERRQAMAEQRQQAQAQRQAERQAAVQQQRQQAQAQRNAERQAMAQQQRQQAQAQRQQQQARAPSAQDRGQPAAARERPARPNAAKDNGRPEKGHGKKD